jgi:hypothetical protein
MKQHLLLKLTLLAVGLAASSALAEQDVTNHLSLSARFGFNISAKFKGVSGLSSPAGASRTTPHGDAYNYDDGYILTDTSGNFGGQSWYWGYDNSASQVSGNNVLLSRSAFSGSTPSATADGDPGLGAELVYSRPLGSWGRFNYGFELAGNYLNVSLHNSRALSASVQRMTDAYGFTPGTTPPSATPGNPYQGSFEGPGFLISDTPSSTTSSVIPNGATIVGHRDYNADVWGVRLGPTLEYPISKRFEVSLSGGLAAAFVSSDASWSESVRILGSRGTALSGSGSGSDFLWGFYIAGNVAYELSQRWSLVGSAQYQYLGTYERNFGGRSVEANFGNTIFFTAGIGFKF